MSSSSTSSSPPTGGSSQTGSSALMASNSATTTVVCAEITQETTTAPPVLVLRLEGRRGIQWDEATVDNEHLCRKSSKRKLCTFTSHSSFKSNFFSFYDIFSQILSLTSSIYKSITTGCCIFHKKKSYDESDSDESASDIEEAEKADAEPKDGKIPAYQRHHA